MEPQHTETAKTRPTPPRPDDSPIAEFRVGDVVKGAKDSYLLRQVLGRGAFGIVFEAVPASAGDAPSPDQRLAVKVFHLGKEAGAREFVLREISSLLAIKSDRIPRVIDWMVGDGTGFLVLPFYGKGSLFQQTANGPISEEEGWRLLLDLLAGAKAAHGASLLHLDIKPANVLIDDGDGYVLVDFSLAQGDRMSPEYLAAGLGTPGYQAPEQERRENDRFDARTDLWGIGATVWSALAGIRLGSKVKLRGATGTEPLTVVGTAPPPAPLPPRIAEILDKLLQADQGDRPGSAAEVLGLIEDFALGTSLPGHALATSRVSELDSRVIDEVFRGMLDPLWHVVFTLEMKLRRQAALYRAGELLARRGERSFYAYILLRGAIAVERGGQRVSIESREGALVGEVSTLSGSLRTADLIAIEDTWVVILNGAELEELVTKHPSVGVRMLKTLAARLVQATSA